MSGGSPEGEPAPPEAAPAPDAAAAPFLTYFRSHPGAAYLWRRDGDEMVLVEFNDEAKTATSGAVEGLVGRTLTDLFAGHADFRDAMWQALRTRSSATHEMTYRYRMTGVVRELRVTHVYVPPDRVAVHTEDITEARRTASERDRRARRMLEIFGAIPDGVAVWSEDEVLYTNPALHELVGRPPGDAEDLRAEDVVHPEDLGGFRDHTRRLHRSERFEPARVRLLRSDGTPVPVEAFTATVRLEERAVWVTVLRDLRVLQRQEEELQAQKDRLERAQRLAGVGYWQWYPTQGTVVWSDHVYVIYGLRRADFGGTAAEVLERVHPEDRPLLRSQLEAARSSGARFETVHRIVRPSGEVRHLRALARVERNDDGAPTLVDGVVMDVTAVQAAEEHVRRSRARLRRLAGRLQEELEEERARLARDLHDEMGQRMTVLRMGLDELRGELEPLGAGVAGRLDRLERLVGETVEWSRALARGLRPSLLDNLGLHAALESLTEEFSQRTGVGATLVSLAPAREPPPEVATALFRICQEALTNVTRHARATHVGVDLSRERDHWVLVVEDDGVGMEREMTPDDWGMGLQGMYERALAVGGDFQVGGAPGLGTTVWAAVPDPEGTDGEGSP